jgi:hypothetical protein
MGTLKVVMVEMQYAISPARRPTSAAESSAPAVSMSVTSGRPTVCAWLMARGAARSAAGRGTWSVCGPTSTHR